MKTIAIAGKGGTGKTTIAALITRWLKEHKARPILAVDADSNVNLNDVLGVELKETIGVIREEAKILAHKLPAGMTKQQFLEYKIQTSLVETPDFDLIAMGRPEGPGCYCYANNLLRDILRTLSANYQYVLIDNQAGMEHLSRRIAQNIDYMLLISDPSVRGVRSAARISRLIIELEARVRERYLILNRIQNCIPQQVMAAIEEEGLNLFQSIPEDEKLLALDQNGKPIGHIKADSPAYQAINQLMKKLIDF
jgi:CO dehydrogenase maturation factor